MNYSDPSGHGIRSKLKRGWENFKSSVKSTASKAWSSVKKTASNIYNKARTGLNNYMNSSTYKSYFDHAKSSGGGSRTGASTGNGYVGRNSGSGNISGVDAGYRYYGGGSGGSSSGGVNGNTSYSYVRYNREPSYKLTIGGTTRYYQTEAEKNTAKQVCETADRIEKDKSSDPTKYEDLLKLAATGLILVGVGAATVATGGTLLPGLVGTIVGGASGGLGNLLSGGNVLDGILSGMVNGAVVGLVSGLVPIGGSIVANFVGGAVGGTYNAFLGGDNRVKTFASFGLSAAIQTVTSGPWGNFVGKTVPITNTIDAVGSGIASWIGETGYITTDRVAHILLGM